MPIPRTFFHKKPSIHKKYISRTKNRKERKGRKAMRLSISYIVFALLTSDQCAAKPALIQNYSKDAPIKNDYGSDSDRFLNTQKKTQPKKKPSKRPTSHPHAPTIKPMAPASSRPSLHKANRPTETVSRQPSQFPIKKPTTARKPTKLPKTKHTDAPKPTKRKPTVRPQTRKTTTKPSNRMTRKPTRKPTPKPVYRFGSRNPLSRPSTRPTSKPTTQPVTKRPSTKPLKATKAPVQFDFTSQPTNALSPKQTTKPTIKPSSRPSVKKTSKPAAKSTPKPTVKKSIKPSVKPSNKPSSQSLTAKPSSKPSIKTSSIPIANPSSLPASKKTAHPSTAPSRLRTARPSVKPSVKTSSMPIANPTSIPTNRKSALPSTAPSRKPSAEASVKKSIQPSVKPSNNTARPSVKPSAKTSSIPIANPSSLPTSKKTAHPSTAPSTQHTARPSVKPSVKTSSMPIANPTSIPTNRRSAHPSTAPSRMHTTKPSSNPSNSPAPNAAVTVTFASSLTMNGVSAPQSPNEATLMANVLKPSIEAIMLVSSVVTITQIGSYALNNRRRRRHLQQGNESNVNVAFTTQLSSLCPESDCNSTAETLFNHSKSLLSAAINSGNLITEIINKASAQNDGLFATLYAINNDSLNISDPVIQIVAATRPPTISPTPIKSHKPTLNPSVPSICKDSTEVFIWPNGLPVTCQYVIDNVVSGVCSAPAARINCPVVCNACSSITQSPTATPSKSPTYLKTSKPSICKDSNGIFPFTNGSPVTCQWVMDNLASGACLTLAARVNCAVTCNSCGASSSQSPSMAPTRNPTNRIMSMTTKAPAQRRQRRIFVVSESTNKKSGLK